VPPSTKRDSCRVQRMQGVSAMSKGNAYFTTPENLGQYLLMDFLPRKMKMIH
jgi:uncharacterized protein with von Willebrand factor type A (vWA) domain